MDKKERQSLKRKLQRALNVLGKLFDSTETELLAEQVKHFAGPDPIKINTKTLDGFSFSMPVVIELDPTIPDLPDKVRALVKEFKYDIAAYNHNASCVYSTNRRTWEEAIAVAKEYMQSCVDNNRLDVSLNVTDHDNESDSWQIGARVKEYEIYVEKEKS